MPPQYQNQSALDVIDTQLESLAREEARYHDELRRIQQRRDLLCRQRALIQRGKTIYSLPTEILLHIFCFFVQWDEDDWQDGEEIDWRPIILSHVCSTWRAAVLDTSSLWACLDFSRYPGVRPLIIRAKEQPVDVVHGTKPLSGYKPDFRFESVLRNTSPRWHSLLWESSELRMTDVLSVLNSGASFPYLRSVELGIEKRSLPGIPLLNPSSGVQASSGSLLPCLRRMCLSSVSLSELPPTDLPSLRSLTLHFPAKYPDSRANLFRMSSLCSFLARSPALETLVFSDSTPLMDVFVRFDHDTSDHAASLPPNNVAPFTVANLRRFEWSHAPPRDLWKFVAIVKMPALKELELYLDAGDKRWFTYYTSVLEPMADEPFNPRAMLPVVRFESLEELSVFVTDTDGLYSAFRSALFPKLKRLAISHLIERNKRSWRTSPTKKAPFAFPLLPAQESIFREPRMSTVTHLALSNFRLEYHNTVASMLAYMQNLEHLAIESCRGTFPLTLLRLSDIVITDVNAVICSLSGTFEVCEEASFIAEPRRWVCPRLQHLSLIDCDNVTFKCLRHTIRARKRCEDGAQIDSLRVIRSPRRRLSRVNVSEGNQAPHDLFSKATALRTLRVERCGRISQAEMESLKAAGLGLKDVYWSD
ncbi:uncharacterized protein PHACADRAFT_249756 [Phanerochaete carnosa HHB-10118-sp]|uniref:Uncharacterized protein n=1 Tax=Phanerochaete carnosa (strain HHB-10118-sp) TaxID=650164 RepID=K5WIZ9_PHACS|nr:uncharacterized protein PHACADRAFT_249756 [Phanerochaete carnosa HHB-10118-sp]EKM59330.1 hypothetical protein PHACADRAFT_249756 [Phanerochaete carnosa HHB-10118-sp]